MPKNNAVQVIPVEIIERRIYLIRGRKVILDSDLAEIYAVPTKALNQAVKRNLDRFPDDFLMQLTAEEAERVMWSQSVTTSKKRRRISHLPLAFTEHGVAMLSSVLRSERAVQMNILIVRVFIKIRELLANNRDLAFRVEKLEERQRKQKSIISILAAEIDDLKKHPAPSSRGIGFTADLALRTSRPARRKP